MKSFLLPLLLTAPAFAADPICDRNYEKLQGDPLNNSDRATHAQVIRWKSGGTPDFGTPVAAGPYKVPRL